MSHRAGQILHFHVRRFWEVYVVCFHLPSDKFVTMLCSKLIARLCVEFSHTQRKQLIESSKRHFSFFSLHSYFKYISVRMLGH